MPKKTALNKIAARPRKIRVAINGFGRIGRAAFKIALERDDMQIVALNDLTDAKTLAHLLQYDTAYGRYEHEVKSRAGAIVVDGKTFKILAQADPAKLPWKKMRVDVVLECTGRFVKDGAAAVHLKAGAQRVIVSAPTKGGDIPTYLLGVNEEAIDSGQRVVSNASCTTNCIAPVAEIMHSKFGIKRAMMTTIHSYTADQRLQDAPHRDLRRARAAGQNIIPTTTGAAISTTEVIPELQGLFDGMAIRVPTIVGSLADFTFVLKQKVTEQTVNAAFRRAAKLPRYQGVLTVSDEPLVSSDIIRNPHSSIVDLSLTKVVGGDMVKVIAWYDNEWGYSNRLIDMVRVVARSSSSSR